MISVNTTNVMSMPFLEFLEALGTIALEKLPEGGINDPDRLTQIDKMLGRFANYYAYLMYLWAFTSNMTNSRKLMQDKGPAHLDAAKRKETLYEIAQAVKMKHEATSRMLTVQQVLEDQRHEHRVYNKDTPFSATRDEVRQARRPVGPDVGKPAGGWASVPK